MHHFITHLLYCDGGKAFLSFNTVRGMKTWYSFFLADAAQPASDAPVIGLCHTLFHQPRIAKLGLYNLQSGKQTFELCPALRPTTDTLIL